MGGPVLSGAVHVTVRLVREPGVPVTVGAAGLAGGSVTSSTVTVTSSLSESVPSLAVTVMLRLAPSSKLRAVVTDNWPALLMAKDEPWVPLTLQVMVSPSASVAVKAVPTLPLTFSVMVKSVGIVPITGGRFSHDNLG